MWLLSNLVCSTQKKVWPTGFVICLQTSLSRAPPCLAKPKEKNRAVNPAVAVFFALKLAFHALSSANPFDVANKKRVWVWMRMFLCAAPQKKEKIISVPPKKKNEEGDFVKKIVSIVAIFAFYTSPQKGGFTFCATHCFSCWREEVICALFYLWYTQGYYAALTWHDKTRNVRYYKCTK